MIWKGHSIQFIIPVKSMESITIIQNNSNDLQTAQPGRQLLSMVTFDITHTKLSSRRKTLNTRHINFDTMFWRLHLPAGCISL